MDLLERRSKTWTVILMVALPAITTSYNVLFMMPLGGRSHKNALYPIAEELGKRGHQVTFYSALQEKTTSKNVHEVIMSRALELSNFTFFSEDSWNMLNPRAMQKTHLALCSLIKVMFSDPFVQDLILHPRVIRGMPRYNIVVVDALFNEFNLPLAHHLGAPVVYVVPTILPMTLAWSMNIPNPSYVQSPLLAIDGVMSFWDRAFTVTTNFIFMNLRSRYRLPSFDERVREYLPDAPSISEIERNVSFVLTNSHFSINPITPSMPYVAHVGGLQCKPAKKLPKDLEDFIQSSGDDGVIYFSFGSVQKGTGVPEDMKKKILTVFKELPQKILWKHETDLENLPSNVKLIDWAPQQDILGHPKVRLFISHCGGLSFLEATYHGIPVLAFPLGVDQYSNAGSLIRLGFGEHLDWRTFSMDDLRDKINRLLIDKKYTENAKKVSHLFRDRPQQPVELAAYWVEYVVKHNGAHHLKSGAEDLNFFQYFALDVVILVSIVVGVVSFLAMFIVRTFILLPSGKPNDKLN